MQIQPLSILVPRVDRIDGLAAFFEAAKNDIRQNVTNGLYETWSTPAIYLYQIQSGTRQHLGVIALNELDDFYEGRIKKHEKTLAKREEEYVHLLQEWQAVIKPVLLTYPAHPDLGARLRDYTLRYAPVLRADIPENGESHQLWAITEAEEITELQRLFAEQVPAAYIADGHHRTSTIAHMALKPAEERGDLDFSHLFCAYFAADQLDILGYHRLVSLPESLSMDAFVEGLSTAFQVTPLAVPRLPEAKREIVLVTAGRQFCLRPKSLPESHVLDATLLNEHVFRQMIGIEEVRTAKNIAYIEGDKGLDTLVELVKAQPDKAGFLLYPVAFEDLFFLSDQGAVLPPKSTWFEPRIKSGLAVHSLKQM